MNVEGKRAVACGEPSLRESGAVERAVFRPRKSASESGVWEQNVSSARAESRVDELACQRELGANVASRACSDGASTPASATRAAGFGSDDFAVCRICPHECRLREGQLGRCRARRARGGEVVCENYGRVTSIALDPIEKKPLARFMPGVRVLSVGSYGCNLRCPFCQNASIADAGPDDVPWREVAPQELVDAAVAALPQGNAGIAYTYNEPLVGYEFMLDTARLAHEAGLVNVLVTNGMVRQEPLSELLPFIDAANVDLKGFSQDFYDVAGGSFATVCQTIDAMAACPTCHLEVTTLVVPGLNDTAEEIDALSAWLATLGEDIPYHVSRFFPCHKMRDRQPTPVSTVYRLADVARRHLTYVYTGNC